VDVDGLLLDMDGVLTVSWEPLPGAVHSVRLLRDHDIPLRVLTNTTSRSRRSIGAALRRVGFAFDDAEILTAAAASAAYLRASMPEARVFLLGDAQAEDLEGTHLVGINERPDLVLISGADGSFTFENLNRVLRILRDGAYLVAMTRTLSWMTNEGECLDAGAYLLGLERVAGVDAVITGKPAPAFFEAALRAIGLPAGRVAMVGDDVINDVLAAQAVGVAGILVRTGKFREEAVRAAHGSPDAVIDSIADLPGLVGIGPNQSSA